MISTFTLAVVLGMGIFVQAAAGFGAGMLIVPILLWMGLAIPEASTALLIATVPQNIMGVHSLRDAIRPKTLIVPAFGRLGFFPVGVLALMQVEQSFPVDRIRQMVGAVVLIATMATILYQPTPRERIASFWAWIAFPVSGFLQGLVGMGGPAMVFWVSAHQWDTRQIRGFLFAMYLLSLAPAIVVLFLFFGARILDPAIQACMTLPVLMLATWIGLKFGNWLGRDRLRRVTLGLLLLMGIMGLASPWFSR